MLNITPATTQQASNNNHSDAAPTAEADDSSFHKKPYTIPCRSDFRDAVIALAAKRKATIGDLARAILTLIPHKTLNTITDPGEPSADDREVVILKSGPAAGRQLRRKPRLQLRLADGYDDATIRRALAVALELDRGTSDVSLEHTQQLAAEQQQVQQMAGDLQALRDENEKLRAMISALSFEPLPNGPKNKEEALYVLGLPATRRWDERVVRARYKMLAMIYHPDGVLRDHERMSQLNAAWHTVAPKLASNG